MAHITTGTCGHEGHAPAAGFAIRKAKLVVFVMPGYAAFAEIPQDLGKHRLGKSGLYFNRLGDLDTKVLKRLIKAGLRDLKTRWTIVPS